MIPAVGIVVRRAVPADGVLLAAALPARGRTDQEWAERVERVRGAADELMLVAEHDGALAGVAEARWLDASDSGPAPAGHYLGGIDVAPAMRRRGVGHALTQARLAWIDVRAETSWYFTSCANPASVALHRAFGFVEVRRAPAFQAVPFEAGEGILFRRDRPSLR